ncbi:MAG: radical SAM protein [Candidatus Omnitrophica bacterium]|nr:radical SAM protein [Candidatus Omnitrophota bacterium]MBU1853428.1 radical SAM protein [Candidatus Omnitrophota bacterium]
MNFPKYLSIQTTSLCNASCVFCPYREMQDIFPPKIMDMNLYNKIIDECANYKNVERIILYMNNEPLTDPYLLERINYAKEKIPWANVHILTNGLLLTEEMAERLINSKLDWIGISFHGIRQETIENAMGIPFGVTLKRIDGFVERARSKKDIKEYVMITFLRHEYLTGEEKEEVIGYWKSKGIERISYFDGPVSRAGNVKRLAKTHNKGRIVGCNSIWADEMIHIVEDGKMVLCCMDWRREHVLGDLNNQSIYEIWNGERNKTWQLIYGKGDMPDGFLCRKCEEAQISEEDLLLIMTPPWQTKMPPLGAAYLSSFLRSEGFKIKVIDLNVKLHNSASEDKRSLWDISTINNFPPDKIAEKFVHEFQGELEDFIMEACNSSAKLIGFSTTIASITIAVYLAHQIKLRDPSKITIIGGPGAYWNTFDIDPKKLIDIFVVGEGELPLLEILKWSKRELSLSGLIGIPGTVICIDQQYLSFLPPNPIKRIDDIPFPDFLEFNLKDYNKEDGYKPLPLLISRGCINRCSFCIDHKMNNPFRIKDPHKVVEEMKFHVKHYDTREFEFNDLLCNGNLKQLEKICDLIIEENIDIKWSSYAAIREGMSLELCRKMYKSGCMGICYGMESASDIVLKKMNKRYDSQLAEEVIRNTHNAGIKSCINIVIGHPGETEREFRNTYEFIRRNKDYIDQVTNVSTCFVLSETDLMNNPSKFGVYFKWPLKTRWRAFIKKDGLCPNYTEYYTGPDNGPYSRARRLRRFLGLLHKENVPYLIINYIKPHNENLDEFIEADKRKRNLKYKYFELNVSEQGRCKLFCKNLELTRDVGMNASFFVNNKWIDSSTARWDVKRHNAFVDIKIRWPEFPITQHWTVKFTSRSIDWGIEIFFHEGLRIFQSKIGVMLVNKYNKYILNDSIANFPSFSTKKWQEILFSRISEIGLVSSSPFPGIVLKPKFEKEVFIQLQNSPSSLLTRMVNVCFFENSNPEGFNNDGHYFKKGEVIKGKIAMSLDI